MNSAINRGPRDTANSGPAPRADAGGRITPDERMRALTLPLMILFALSGLLWAAALYLGPD